MDYQNYKPEDFVNNRSFVRWVIEPDSESSTFWDRFLDTHPEKKKDVQIAVDLILKVDLETPLKKDIDKDAKKIWSSLEKNFKGRTFINRQINLLSTYWVQVAATLILVLGFSYLLNSYIGHLKQLEAISESVIVEKYNPKGRKSIITLSDRSRIELNAESSIQFEKNFRPNSREVSLIGEAFFDVERDESRPFIINANGIKVKVLGTSFNVKSYPGDQEVQVAVLSGKVEVISVNENTSVSLTQNELVNYSRAFGNFDKQTIGSGELVFGWKDRKLVFRNEDLSSITRKLSRWYGVEFYFQGVDKEKKKITGSYDNPTLIEVMKSLSHNYNFEYEIDGKVVTIIN